MKITIVSMHCAPEPTGNAPYVMSLARGLAARAHEVTVVTAVPFYPQWAHYPGYEGSRVEETIDGVRLVRLRHYVPVKMSSLKRLVSESHGGIRAWLSGEIGGDVILFVTPALFHSAISSRRAGSTPWGVWVQDIYSAGMKETSAGGGVAGSVVSSVERSFMRRADGIAVIHDRFGAAIESQLGIDRAKITTIRNWSHLEVPTEVVNRRVQFGWREDELVVVHAGNQGVKQHLDNVVEAARLADSEDVAIRFVLLGDGNQHDHLRALAEGVNRIQFIAPLPDDEYFDALASADVLLVNELPGVKDMSLPSKLTSYFATGRPVLAATDGESVTAAEIRAAGAGLIVSSGSPKGLLHGALEIQADPELAARLGAAGLAFREQVLSQSAAVSAFEVWLENLRARHQPTTGGSS